MKYEFDTKFKKKICSLQNIRLAINTTVGKIRLAQLKVLLKWWFTLLIFLLLSGFNSTL